MNFVPILERDDVLIFDIETSGKISEAKHKWFGAYSYIDNKYYTFDYTQGFDIQKLIDRHGVVVGYNIEKFDIPVLLNDGFSFDRKIIIDLYKLLEDRQRGGKGRAQIMNLRFNDMRLETVAKTLKLPALKQTGFDYKILNKDKWGLEETILITTYLITDVEVTKELFQYYVNFFQSFKRHIPKEDVHKLKWLTVSSGSFAYSAICHKIGVRPEFNDKAGGGEEFVGGDVAEPTVVEEHDDIYCLDYTSAHPLNMIQGNLFEEDCSCCTEEEKYSGKGFFPLFGKYCSKKLGIKAKALLEIFEERVELKKAKNPAQYGNKIIINSAFGISSNPKFIHVYTQNIAKDTTLMSRVNIKFMRKHLEKNGYKFISGDTDSVYIKDVYKDEKRLLKCVKEGVEFLKTKMNFPSEHFAMKIDDRIKDIYFFRDSPTEPLKKKYYVYITNEDKMVIKGIPIKKRNATRISKHIFHTFLKPQIIEKRKIKFNSDYIKDLIYKELKKDISLASVLYKLRDKEEYKTTTDIRYQAIEYLERKVKNGELEEIPMTIKVIKNRRIGFGKNNKYCLLDEFKEKNISIYDINLNVVFSELSYFMGSEQSTLV